MDRNDVLNGLELNEKSIVDQQTELQRLVEHSLQYSMTTSIIYNYITKLWCRRWHLADDETACLVVASSRHISGFYYVTKPNEVLGRDQIAVLVGESHRVWEPECWTVVSVPNKKMFGGLWG